MTYSDLDEQVFKDQVEEALKTVERILEVHRNPRLAQDVEHGYDDKYRLADMLTNTAIIAQMNCLEQWGMTAEKLKAIDQSKSTTLRFQTSDSCSFLKEQTVEVPMERAVETTEDTQTSGSFFGTTKKSTISRIVNHVKEYHWKVDVKWEISVYPGTDVDQRTVLQNRSSSMIIVTQSANNRPPLPVHREHNPLDVSLTWLLKHIDADALTAQFNIDTQNPDTKTPRRNKAVEDTLVFMNNLQAWTCGVRVHFTYSLQRDILNKHNPAGPQPNPNQSVKLSSLSASNLFLPVQPLMEVSADDKDAAEKKTETAAPKAILSLAPDSEDDAKSSAVLSATDMNKLLDQQIRSIQEQNEALQQSYPARHLNKLISVAEAMLVILSEHSENLSNRYLESMEYIEKMLENQLIAAIGKRVESSDLDQFVKYHNARLLDPAPRAFCHSIRRPNHYPDGLLSIESANGDGKMEPIDTLVRELETTAPLKVPLNAATTIELTGKTYLHGWIQHRFERNHKSYTLIARARQFSSFMLVVGTMVGPAQLEPKEAIILQNKDEVLIPLLLNELPTAKEFKDAIKSLSPEQQRFAKAFRSMQLGSSVFGVCVIQIKPQLEELLGLPLDALTKEMKLTQELMELFVEYQVPSDLLSYDGDDENLTVKDKVDNVKGHVKAVLDVIGNAKTKQLENQAMRADMAFESAVEDKYDAAPTFGSGGELDSEFQFKMMSEGRSGGARSYPSKQKRSPKPMHGRTAHPPPHAPEASRQLQQSAPMMAMRMQAASARKITAASATNESVSMTAAPPQQQAYGMTQQANKSPSSKAEPPSSGVQESAGGTVTNEGVIDFTMIPKILDSAIEKHDADNSLRSTIIKTSDSWTRKRQENLLTQIQSSTLRSSDIKSEKDKAFDLLDALSRSGSLPISCSELHVIISVTHCFEKDVMGTVIQDNINPIEKLEMSTLLVASTIHGVPANVLVRDAGELRRLTASLPTLLEASESDDRVESVEA